MSYLVQGTAQQLFQAFGQEWVTAIKKGGTQSQIARELYQSKFWGTEEQAQYHRLIWQTSAHPETYCQGDMSAGNLSLLLRELQPLMRKNETIEAWQQNYRHQEFAYVSERQELCGLMLIYRQDDPTQWMLGLVKNTNWLPKDRTVMLLSGFNLAAFLKNPTPDVQTTSVDAVNNPFMDNIGSDLITALLQQTLTPNGSAIDLKFNRVGQLLRQLQRSTESRAIQDPAPLTEIDPKLLFADNHVLSLIAQYDLYLSSALLKESLSASSRLCRAIKQTALTSDYNKNKQILQLTVIFYAAGIYTQGKAVIQDNAVLNALNVIASTRGQNELIVALIKGNYQLELLQLILSKEAYYSTVFLLDQLGLTEDIPKFFTQANKLQQLEYIHSLTSETCKKLCLVFWTKGNLTLTDYEQIVAATKEYRHPDLAETLLALDKTGEYSIEDLQHHALTPQKHLQKSIRHHFAGYFTQFVEIKHDLNQFTETTLLALIQSLNVLKQAQTSKSFDAYNLATKSNHQGLLLRLFLPQMAAITDIEIQRNLIELLYTGIVHGVVTQRNAIKLIAADKMPLSMLAKDLQERFTCAKQMQLLEFNSDLIAFAAKAESTKASRFRQIINDVEVQCESIQERLSLPGADRLMLKQWQLAEIEYRKTVYQIAYDALTSSRTDLQDRMQRAESKVLKIVDPEMDSWLQTILMVIANILITACTLGYANKKKQERTGNLWFFNQTPSGEEIRTLDRNIVQLGSCSELT
ncbi:MAG: hypothetical protein ACHP65_02045 [Legionellales bacterium]